MQPAFRQVMTNPRRIIGIQKVRPATAGDCAACPAESVGLFSGAFRRQRAYLIDGFRIVQVAPQETLYGLGDTAEYVFLMRYGLMKLVRYSAAGDERIVRLAGKGDTFGLEALSAKSYRHTAVALGETALCRVPAQVILGQEKSDPRFVERVMTVMQAELDSADLFLTELSTGGAHTRVARLLLYLAEREGGRECLLPMRDEIGALLGITMETASRVTAEFRRSGLIRPAADPQRVALDLPGLTSLASG